MNNKRKLRRSGAKIIARLILLLGSLAYVMMLTVINGSAGYYEIGRASCRERV